MVGSNTITAIWTINPKTTRMLQSSTTSKAVRKIATATVAAAGASEILFKFFAILFALLLVL